jgi:hypothetical protein
MTHARLKVVFDPRGNATQITDAAGNEVVGVMSVTFEQHVNENDGNPMVVLRLHAACVDFSAIESVGQTPMILRDKGAA